jgi:hypothetical protein
MALRDLLLGIVSWDIKGTAIDAVMTFDTFVLILENHPFRGMVESSGRGTNFDTAGFGAVHAALVKEQPTHVIILLLFNEMNLVEKMWRQVRWIFITAAIHRRIRW